MDIHTASELSYQNGYIKGFQAAKEQPDEPQGWTCVKYEADPDNPLQLTTLNYQHRECPVNSHASYSGMTPFCPQCGAPMTARMKHATVPASAFGRFASAKA